MNVLSEDFIKFYTKLETRLSKSENNLMGKMFNKLSSKKFLDQK